MVRDARSDGATLRPEVEAMILDRVRLRVARMLTERDVALARSIEVLADREAESLVVLLEATLAAKTSERRWEDASRSARVVASVEVPATWWDHLKQSWNGVLGWGHLSGRALATYGLRVRTRTIETRLEATMYHQHHVAVTRVCPHVALPDRGGRPCVAWLADPEALRPEWAEVAR